VGRDEGILVGAELGFEVGLKDGTNVVGSDGEAGGVAEGLGVGSVVGFVVGRDEGILVGAELGFEVGLKDGTNVVGSDGEEDGVAEGFVRGLLVFGALVAPAKLRSY
jgi:hypothetical protein